MWTRDRLYYAQHNSSYPEMERPAQAVNIGRQGIHILMCNDGSCFIPQRMSQPLLEQDWLFRMPDSPDFKCTVYKVFPLQAGFRCT